MSIILPALIALGAGQVGEPLPENGSRCGLPEVSNIAELTATLGERAIDAVSKATMVDWENDPILAAMIKPDAEIRTGGGDVGLPMGRGVSGLRALAEHMKADSFKYDNWSYIPYQIDPCAEFKIKVDFMNTENRYYTRVEFQFENGLISSVKGWGYTYNIGTVPPVTGMKTKD